MANSFAVSRAAIVYALILPVAVLVGFFMADPTAFGSVAIFLLLAGILLTPILMRWHHPLLILSWNAAINPFFLPGRPYLWMLMSVCSLFFAVVNRSVDGDRRLNRVPALTRPLILLLLVVVATGFVRGGFGSRAFGSDTYGGKGYYYIIAAIAGYFALSAQRIPPERGQFYAGLFFISGLSALIPNISYAAGSSFNFLFYLFPPEYAIEQAIGSYSVVTGIFRIYGLTIASAALYCWLMATYGLRGVLSLHHPWRLGLFILAWVGCMFCGFRSYLILFLMLFAAQFWVERMFRTRVFPVLLGLGLMGSAVMLHQLEEMPLVVQRTLSFLPVRVSPLARESAEASLEWRLAMWQIMAPEVPKYLLLGKGYRIDPNEFAIAAANTQRDSANTMQTAIMAGDYHNGPLSLLIPFGLPGLIAVGWFWVVTFRHLLWNYRWGHPELKRVNTFLLVLFTVKLAFFLLVFGGFYADIYMFAGIAGLSVSLNGLPVSKPEEETTVPDTDLWAALPRRF